MKIFKSNGFYQGFLLFLGLFHPIFINFIDKFDEIWEIEN